MRGLLALLPVALLAASTRAADNDPYPTISPRYQQDGLDRLTAVTTDEGTTAYAYFDSGSVAGMTDPAGIHYGFLEGAVPASLASPSPNFLPFIATTLTHPLDLSANRFGFTGYLFEREVGLYLTPSGRLYDPALGRFIQQDSYLGDILQVPSLHRYLYARTNPTRYVDPTGHDAFQIEMQQSGLLDPQVATAVNNAEARAAGSLWGALRWAGRDAWGVVNLALGRGWEGFGERAVEATGNPAKAMAAAADAYRQHVDEQLDLAHRRIVAGDHFGAGAGFTEEVTAPALAVVAGAAGPVRGGVRALAERLGRQPGAIPVSVALESGTAFTVVEGGSGVDALPIERLSVRPIPRGAYIASEMQATTAVTSSSARIERLAGPKLEHINASIAELHGYEEAISAGHLPIRGPGKTTARGADYLTYDPVRQEVVLWDSKYRSATGASVPRGVSTAKIQRWLPEARRAVDSLPDTAARTEMVSALEAGRVRGEIFKWPR